MSKGSMKDFQVLTKIGDGAYSEVYKVRRSSDMGVYALKKVRHFHKS
jgi:NIMA (never in mitosis gene a)-related kinase 1/4/5